MVCTWSSNTWEAKAKDHLHLGAHDEPRSYNETQPKNQVSQLASSQPNSICCEHMWLFLFKVLKIQLPNCISYISGLTGHIWLTVFVLSSVYIEQFWNLDGSTGTVSMAIRVQIKATTHTQGETAGSLQQAGMDMKHGFFLARVIYWLVSHWQLDWICCWPLILLSVWKYFSIACGTMLDKCSGSIFCVHSTMPIIFTLSLFLWCLRRLKSWELSTLVEVPSGKHFECFRGMVLQMFEALLFSKTVSWGCFCDLQLLRS